MNEARASRRQRRRTGLAELKGHGLSRTPEYRAWVLMVDRCTNERNTNYPRYGGRGITVCLGWLRDPAVFVADVGPRPSEDHSIDRQDNEGGYQCGRCDDCVSRGAKRNGQWATRETQNANRSTTRLVTAWGRTQPLTQWAKEKWIHRATLTRRLNIGMKPEEAMTLPPARGSSCARRLEQMGGDDGMG